MTKELSRTSALASRHTELGSGLEDWNGMGTAWTYNTNPNDEHDAVRENVGMFDMSPLKKVFVKGQDAQEVLNHLTTKEMAKITKGKAAYLCVLNENGGIADDAIVSNNGDDEWMIVHGSGDTMNLLTKSAEGKKVEVKFDDDLHDISVQGPKALEVLNANCDANLEKLKYFEHTNAKLFDQQCRISRTGYSGEKGYEVFVNSKSVTEIWDKLRENDVMPCSFTALDKVRIEAGLLFYGYDMTEENTPWEVGLGFAISKNKKEFRGKEKLEGKKGKENVKNVCIVIEHTDMIEGGEILSMNDEDVGVVNSPCYSHRMEKSLALAHVKTNVNVGDTLMVKSDEINTTAVVVDSPIYDPQKTRTHA